MFSKSYLNEIWKPVVGYYGLYEVSSFGRVRSLNYNKTGTGKIMKPNKSKKNYLRVELWKNRKQQRFFVHRLVWEAFNGPIPEGMQCNHLDENPQNNRLENLSLVTPKENINWGTRNAKVATALSKPVLQFTKDGEFVAEYSSTHEAEKQTGIYQTNISHCCQGKRKSAGVKGGPKYIWKYS